MWNVKPIPRRGADSFSFQEMSNHVFHTCYNLCRLNKGRQEEATPAGIIPLLMRVIESSSPSPPPPSPPFSATSPAQARAAGCCYGRTMALRCSSGFSRIPTSKSALTSRFLSWCVHLFRASQVQLTPTVGCQASIRDSTCSGRAGASQVTRRGLKVLSSPRRAPSRTC